ncbi:alanine racemase [candidate division KSB1 bacterium]|nr:alanine racemase [candidate division KSB1 bacterium]
MPRSRLPRRDQHATAALHEQSFETQRPTIAEIDLQAIASNVRAIRQRVRPAEVMAVVKAEGYGHGAVQVARIALEAGATLLGVALLEEGIALRRHGFTVPILVFGGLFENQIDSYLAHDLQMTLYDARLAEIISQRAQALHKTAGVHAKFDTGMGRVGVTSEPLAFLQHLVSLPGITLQGLYTHLATSDETDLSYAHVQLQRFRTIITAARAHDIVPRWIHAANSGAILSLPESYFNLVRPGVMMYGYYPSADVVKSLALQPAMRLRTAVLLVKRVPRGTFVSYNRTFQTQRESVLATLPIGYADGFSRRFSNNMHVLIRGCKCPVVGRVCMDQIIVDVTELPDIRVGEEVVLMGKHCEEEIPIYDWCEKLETIPYEVTCGISSRVPRVNV